MYCGRQAALLRETEVSVVANNAFRVVALKNTETSFVFLARLYIYLYRIVKKYI